MPEIHLTFQAIASFFALVAILLPAAYFVGRSSARLGSLEEWRSGHEKEHKELWKVLGEIRDALNKLVGRDEAERDGK